MNRHGRRRSDSRTRSRRGVDEGQHAAPTPPGGPTPARADDGIAENRTPSAARSGVEIALCLVFFLFFLATAVAFVKLFLDTTVGERATATAAALIVAYDIVEITSWRGAALLRSGRSLWRQLLRFVLCFLATLTICVVAFSVGTHSLLGLVAVLAFVPVAFLRDRVEGEICSALAALGVEPPRPRFGGGAVDRLREQIQTHSTRGPRTGGPLEEVVDVLQRRLARALSNRSVSEHRDFRHLVTALMIGVALFVAFWTSVAWAVRGTDDAIHAIKTVVHEITRQRPIAHGSIAEARPPEPAASAPAGEPAASAAAPAPTPDFTFRNLCPTPLVKGGPPPLLKTLTELYLGGSGVAGAGAPGTSIAGCPGELHLTYAPQGLFAFVLGKSVATDEVLSVAVDSPLGFGLALGPAVKPVLGLIQRFGVVGAVHRYAAGTGDFVSVEVPGRGTYILARRETGTAEAGDAYTVIPPPVAQVWASSIAASHEFLWPVLHNEGDATVYDFDSDTEPSSVSYVFPYAPTEQPEPELNETELASDARLAR